MITWDSFDLRVTKVICDKCHEDITESFLAGLRKMDFSISNEYYQRIKHQISFPIWKWVVSITIYRRFRNPSWNLKKLRIRIPKESK
jgi:hypothetical protein